MDTITKENGKRSFNNILIHFLVNGIHFAYKTCVKPRSHNEDIERKELVLNSILCEVIILITLLNLSVVYNSIRLGSLYHGVSFYFFSVFLAIIISLLFLSRKGYTELSSYALIGMFFVGTLYSSYTWGMSLPAGLLSYAFIILISSILINTRFGLFVSGTIVLLLITLAYKESVGGIIPSWQGRPTKLVNAFQYSTMLIFITALAFIYSQDIERSLKRARLSEEKLKNERDLLEIRVEERTAELRIAQAEEISQLNRFAEFGRMSSGLFHDLVSPLFSVALNIESLNSSLHPDLPSIKNHLRLSLASSKKMERFIIAVKRQIQLNDIKESFCLNHIIEDVIMLLQHKATREKVCIDFISSERLFTYHNPLKFHQIISNLIVNAIDSHTESNIESINVEKSVLVSLSQNEGQVSIDVTDNGSGISPSIISNIFDQFFTTKEYRKGMGIGLSNTKQYVEKDFNGTISVKSVEGQGSTFSVSFLLTPIPKNNDSS